MENVLKRKVDVMIKDESFMKTLYRLFLDKGFSEEEVSYALKLISKKIEPASINATKIPKLYDTNVVAT